jgi:hypothetical protein
MFTTFTAVDGFAIAGGLVLAVIGAFLGFACIPRDVDTDRLGCSAMWHEPSLAGDEPPLTDPMHPVSSP